MEFLIEIDAFNDATGQAVPLRYATKKYITGKNDVPAHTEYEERIQDAGNYERFMFGKGRTRGESDVGTGNIKLANANRALDFLLDLSFDGRPIRIYGIEDRLAPYSSRIQLFAGTMEQVTYESRSVTIRIRDRLALLRETLQTLRFKGTTISGSSTDAEGGKDLKDVLVPELFGSARGIEPVVADGFYYIFRVARRLDGVTSVRDYGVPLAGTQDYPTVAALKAATIAEGKYATCLAFGMVRTKLKPKSLTVDAYEGATLADRSAARIAQRMMPSTVSVNVADFDALHALNPAECYFYTGTNEIDRIAAALRVLQSIGAYLTVDRLGVVSTGRLELPTGQSDVVITEKIALKRDDAFNRAAPQDEGSGLQAKSITVKWGFNFTVYSQQDFDPNNVNITEPYRSFASQEWRQVVRESAANKANHPLAPELTFETCLCNEADAIAEADRLMAIYGARRDVFRVSVPSYLFPGLDIGDVITLAPNRFGMSGGVPARVIGLINTYKVGSIQIEAWR